MKQKYRFPSSSSNDPEEVRLSGLLNNFTNSQSDPIFIEQLRELGWMPQDEKTIKNKHELDKFIKNHGYRPDQGSKDPVEKKLSGVMSRCFTEGYPCFDPVIVEKYKDVPTCKEYKIIKKKQDLDQFIEDHGYKPSKLSKDPKERKLGTLLGSYVNKAHGSYDQETIEKYKSIPTWEQYKTLQHKQELDQFIKEHGHRPKKTNTDLKEKSLSWLFGGYTTKSNHSYDQNIVDKYKDVPTWKEFQEKKETQNDHSETNQERS